MSVTLSCKVAQLGTGGLKKNMTYLCRHAAGSGEHLLLLVLAKAEGTGLTLSEGKLFLHKWIKETGFCLLRNCALLIVLYMYFIHLYISLFFLKKNQVDVLCTCSFKGLTASNLVLSDS